jgi:uncharacterized membrane protein
MHKKEAAPIVLMVWMLAMSNVIGLLYYSDLRLFIAFTLVGFFIIVYLIHPMFSQPGYIRSIYRMALSCTALFSLVIFLRILKLIEYWS